MLGIQYPRSLPDPNLPASPESISRRTPPSRERLGLRSLLHPTHSPSLRSGSSHTPGRQEQGVARAMSGAYGSMQPAPSLTTQYGNGTYASAMAGISSQRPMSTQTSSWSSAPSNATYHTNQTSLPASQGQSRAASPEFETHPSLGSDGYNKSNANSNIHPYLQLPPTISPAGGSISEFAAQVCMLGPVKGNCADNL